MCVTKRRTTCEEANGNQDDEHDERQHYQLPDVSLKPGAPQHRPIHLHHHHLHTGIMLMCSHNFGCVLVFSPPGFVAQTNSPAALSLSYIHSVDVFSQFLAVFIPLVFAGFLVCPLL